ncbi:hypothetical protein PISMIDRAFT_204406 [Pisolithus microcarpus 441]|uniref:Uncharacterized protein n=1 Tax=Pisolithus microcarpus 441 TaxID=765257 RepID=A0A0C9ZMY2_9AGAM|nr:hypothetical protein PISMIDRAFT_204406 [Pisolithus microcarpus 441]
MYERWDRKNCECCRAKLQKRACVAKRVLSRVRCRLQTYVNPVGFLRAFFSYSNSQMGQHLSVTPGSLSTQRKFL